MNKLFLIFLTILFVGMTIVQAQDPASKTCDSATEEKNKTLARKFYEKVWFSNNPEVVDEIFAPEYIVHDTGDVKGVTEPSKNQKDIAAFFWDNGAMSGSIDYQISECDLVATRWQWKYQPTTWWFKVLGGRDQIPIINVFRFKNGKIVEIWNHRHDIDTAQGNIPLVKGLFIGLIPSLILLIVSFILWRKVRRQKRTA